MYVPLLLSAIFVAASATTGTPQCLRSEDFAIPTSSLLRNPVPLRVMSALAPDPSLPWNISAPYSVHCAGRDMPDLDDMADAIKWFSWELDRSDYIFVDPARGHKWTWGNAQIYFCNFTPKRDLSRGWTQNYFQCTLSAYHLAMRLVDSYCGEGAAGWFAHGESDNYWAVIGRDALVDEQGAKISGCNVPWESVDKARGARI